MDFKFVTEYFEGYGVPTLREVSYVSDSWYFAILFVVLILMVLNKYISLQHKNVSVVSMSFQNNSADKMVRESQSFFNIASVSVLLSFILLISLFIQKIFVICGGNVVLHDNFNFYIDVVICVSAFFVYNYLLVFFYGWLFKTENLIFLHVGMHVSSMTMCNFLLLPMILLLMFYPYNFFLVITLMIIAIFYIVRIAKFLVEIRMLSKLNFVNIFLYLCTIEILPVIVISKMIINNM